MILNTLAMVWLVPNVGSDVAWDVNFDCINTISYLTFTTVTEQALTELMLVIPTLPALMPLDHKLVAVMLFSVATDSLVPISTNICVRFSCVYYNNVSCPDECWWYDAATDSCVADDTEVQFLCTGTGSCLFVDPDADSSAMKVNAGICEHALVRGNDVNLGYKCQSCYKRCSQYQDCL